MSRWDEHSNQQLYTLVSTVAVAVSTDGGGGEKECHTYTLVDLTNREFYNKKRGQEDSMELMNN